LTPLSDNAAIGGAGLGAATGGGTTTGAAGGGGGVIAGAVAGRAGCDAATGGRAEREGVSQEQLAVYDLLVGVEVTLAKNEQAAVKKIAADLPKQLEKRLVIDWRKSQMKRAAVRVAIKTA
jgi:hypothetical protein